MQKYKIDPAKTSYYFCTCTVVEWLCIFKEEKYFQVIIDSLNYCRKNKGLYLYGLVIMLNHLHMIVSTKDNILLSDVMRDFKRHTSTKLAEFLEADNEKLLLHFFKKAAEKQKGNIKVWQDEYHPIALYSHTWFNEKLNYTHYNPVRKGYVLEPEDWKYTTARNWFNGADDVISIDLEYL